MKGIYIILCICLLMWSCQEVNKTNNKTTEPALVDTEPTKENKPVEVDEPSVEVKEEPTPSTVEIEKPIEPKVEPTPDPTPAPVVEHNEPAPQHNSSRYPWLENYKEKDALVNQIPVPAGYKRVAVAKGSFGEWLRYLPMEPKGTPVMLYNGGEKPYQSGANRVVNIDIGNRDLQQCADAVMRLKA
ncbi:MAG: hypothetical protein GY810_25205 [Aureispira sp.]|nr:hypothetical protein [Aureispira sp.]